MKAGSVYHVSSPGALGLERIFDLETKLAHTPIVGRRHRELVKAIGIAAAAYRMALDNEQAMAMHRAHPVALGGRASGSLPIRKPRASKRSHS